MSYVLQAKTYIVDLVLYYIYYMLQQRHLYIGLTMHFFILIEAEAAQNLLNAL